MNFEIPTKIITEKGCVRLHADVFANAGKKALLVTGRNSAVKTGAQSDVLLALAQCNIPYCIFNEIEENPSVETIEKASKFGLAEQADFVIGIGGGSPLDASKAIALMMAHPTRGTEILYSKDFLKELAPGTPLNLPVYAIPTTAGTGSEATPYSILTLHEEKTKRSISHRIFPVVALIDPTYLTEAPLTVLRNTAVDAFGHLVESYFNTKSTHYNRMLIEYALKLWGAGASELASIDPSYAEKPDAEEPSKNPLKKLFSRFAEKEPVVKAKGIISLSSQCAEKLSLASTLAGMAISHTGTSLPHGLSYSLTYEQGIPHGDAIGIFQVPYLRYIPEQDKVTSFLAFAGLESLNDLENLLIRLIAPATVMQTDVDRYVDSMLSNAAKLANCPYSVDKERLTAFYTENMLIKVEN